MDLIYSVTSSSPPQRRIKWSGIVIDIIIKKRWRKGGRWMDKDVHNSLHPAPSANRASRPFSRPSLTLPALKSKAASTEDASLTQWKGEKAYRMVERVSSTCLRERRITAPCLSVIQGPTSAIHELTGSRSGPQRAPREQAFIFKKTYEQSDQIDRIRVHRRLPVRA